MKEFQDLGMISYNSNRQLTVGEMVSYLVMLLTGVVDCAEGNEDDKKMTSSSNQPDVVSFCADLVLNWLLNVYDQYVYNPSAFLFYLCFVHSDSVICMQYFDSHHCDCNIGLNSLV